MAIEIKNLIKYIANKTDFKEDGIAIVMCCNEPDMANEMLGYLKANVGIEWDDAIKKAVAIREQKYGKQKFVIDD